MSGSGMLKPDRDFTKDVDKQLPEAEKLAKSNVQAAVDKLTILEKQTRQASDLASTSRLLVAIVTICKDSGDWGLVNEQILLLSKKHGQLKQATTKMVQVAMGFIDEAPDQEKKLSLIETLRTVTEGKIFVEVERARVTRILSTMKKEQGDVKAAADILCELQVETFGSMARREKTEFILDQVALCIENDDWTQAGILSRKIGTKYFTRKPTKTPEQMEKEAKELEEREKNRSADDPPVEKPDDVTDLKLRYYEQQVSLAKHSSDYLSTCKHYRQVLDTQSVEENPAQLKAVLQRVIFFILLSSHSNEQSDLLHRIASDTRNESLIPLEASLLKIFTIPELMRWPAIEEQYGPHLTSTDVFSSAPPASKGDTSDPEDLSDSALASRRYADLRKRVIEHNVRVIAQYYTRITISRLCTLLDLSEQETETYISDLVTSKTVYARIDRPARVVSFEKVKTPDEVLNDWSGDVTRLLGKLERIDHLITKEEMVANAGLGVGGKDGGVGKGKGKGVKAK